MFWNVPGPSTREHFWQWLFCVSGGILSSHLWLHQTVGSRSQGQEVWLTTVSPDPSTVAGLEQRPLSIHWRKEEGATATRVYPADPPGTGGTDTKGPSRFAQRWRHSSRSVWNRAQQGPESVLLLREHGTLAWPTYSQRLPHRSSQNCFGPQSTPTGSHPIFLPCLLPQVWLAPHGPALQVLPSPFLPREFPLIKIFAKRTLSWRLLPPRLTERQGMHVWGGEPLWLGPRHSVTAWGGTVALCRLTLLCVAGRFLTSAPASMISFLKRGGLASVLCVVFAFSRIGKQYTEEARF